MPRQKQKVESKKIANPKMPKWMDCAWRRVPCNKDKCRICGKIKQDRLRHVAMGKNTYNIAIAPEDVGRNFKEALMLIKKDAERMGIDITNIDNIKQPPEPHKFRLYRKVARWRDSIYDIADDAEETGSFWLATEPAQELLWYTNTLTAKTYRQLCNRWHIEKGDDYGDFDNEYTKYVLSEVINIIKKSLSELAYFESDQKGELMLAIAKLTESEEEILKI